MKRWLKWFLILLPFGLVIFGLVVWYERRKKANPAAAVAPGIASFGVGGGAPGGAGGGSSVSVVAGQVASGVSMAQSLIQGASGLFGAIFGGAGAGKAQDLGKLFGLSGNAMAQATTGVQDTNTNSATLADGSTLTWDGGQYVDTPSVYAVPDFSSSTDFAGGSDFGVLNDTSGSGWSDPGPISGGDGSGGNGGDSFSLGLSGSDFSF